MDAYTSSIYLGFYVSFFQEVDTVSQIPDDVPYYVCSGESKRSLSVSLSVRKSVRMCPSIMDKLVGYNISFGTVMMRPTLPTCKY